MATCRDDKPRVARYRAAMRSLRRHIHRRLHVAWALIALTLAMKLIVPVGFMPGMTHSGIAIVVCSGMGPAKMIMPMPGGHDAPAKAETPCLGAGVAAPILPGADPIQLEIAFAAILIAGLLLAVAPPRRPTAYIRPHTRGPPRTV